MPLSSITTYRYKPGRGPLMDKVPNFRPRFDFERSVVPPKVASTSTFDPRTMNKSGRPTR